MGVLTGVAQLIKASSYALKGREFDCWSGCIREATSRFLMSSFSLFLSLINKNMSSSEDFKKIKPMGYNMYDKIKS